MSRFPGFRIPRKRIYNNTSNSCKFLMRHIIFIIFSYYGGFAINFTETFFFVNLEFFSFIFYNLIGLIIVVYYCELFNSN